MPEYIKTSSKINGDRDILYPGERTFRVCEKNLKDGISVNENIWGIILKL